VRRIVAGSMLLVLALPVATSAHRLDEYLQASRVSIARQQVTLEIDLTPGASIAARVVALVDRDHDGRISPIEAAEYGRAVVRDAVLEVDGRPVSLTLTRAEASSIGEMSEGLGSIRLVALGSLREAAAAGRHQLHLRNDHHPESSVYLVNALVPQTPDVSVARQIRDIHQRDFHLDYDIRPAWPARIVWLTLGLTGLAALIVMRRRLPTKMTN
jgi:hypothetical protein